VPVIVGRDHRFEAVGLGRFCTCVCLCAHLACAGDPKRLPSRGRGTAGYDTESDSSLGAVPSPRASSVDAGNQRDAACPSDAPALGATADEDMKRDAGDDEPHGFGICSGPREIACPATATGGTSEWTTLPDTNRCCRFPRSTAPRFAKYPSRAACETWVRQRRCRPGWTAFDGCNSYSCSEDGRSLHSTMAGACYVAIFQWIRFAPGSAELSDQARCDIRTTLPQFSRSIEKGRGIVIKGFIHTADPSPRRTELALDRARAVKRLLAESGVPDENTVALADREVPMGVDPPVPVVTFDLFPNEVPIEPVRRPPPACSELRDGG
jgi:outer membrane protein OmpA-like peptidoglycan-associated protein